MKTAVKLHMDVCRVLCDIENVGIKVDVERLRRIETDFKNEYIQLETDLQNLIREFCGDTPINLASAEDRSKLFYSLIVRDKKEWKTFFDLGTEIKNGKRKKKFIRVSAPRVFRNKYQYKVGAFLKTERQVCKTCRGRGTIEFIRKDGTYGMPRRCKICFGKGNTYKNLKERAGLGLLPLNEKDLSVHGFKTDVATIKEKLLQVRGLPKQHEFLTKYMRYNALATYLNTFIENIKNNTGADGFIHPQFMQCVTATGRLSSRNPNFQNMPRSSTFPVREAIISRFKGGKILEGDYSQLEFRVAAFLSQDPQALQDIKDKIDVHAYTAEIIGVSRQEAKAHTFKPLYGGRTGTPSERRYYEAFLEKYSGIAKWHEKLGQTALVHKKITLPSGREYMFPNVRRFASGGVSNGTQIKNYPVQGFATADLLPVALVSLHKKINQSQIKSLICNTVHDSIVMDVHPEEEGIAIKLLTEAMLGLRKECQSRYGLDYNVPVGIELKLGNDWSNLNPVITKEI
ncbi:MAG: hypothetical protein CMC15_14240 [Flavobacteriaceae bacterium]|nr:hypothetical protein [Flavobacteriaceae bacterium]